MLTALYSFGTAIVRRAMQRLNQNLQQRTKSMGGSAVLEAVSNLMCCKSKLDLENALLRH